MSTEKLNLYQKLALIQSEVKGLGKDKAGNNYKYVTGSKVLEAIKPIMIKHGILLKQEVTSIENVRQDYALKSGSAKSEILSKVMMRFTWIDVDSGEKDENIFGANGQNDWEKGLGSALTYAERYFLLKYFHINTDEDDIDNPERKEEERKEAELLAKENERRLNIQIDLDSAGTVEELGKKYRSLKEADQTIFLAYVSGITKKLTK